MTTDAPRLDFDAASHRYWLAGQATPSVTTILRDLKLTPHYPRTEEANQAMTLGTRVHSATEAHDRGDRAPVDDELAPYVSAWAEFLAHYGGTVTDVEMQVASTRHRYAGTLDRIIRGPGGQPTVLDIKTGSSGFQAWHRLQLSAYQIAWEESGHNLPGLPVKRVICYLQPGAWTMREANDPADLLAWRAAVNVYYWRKWNK